MFFKNNMLCGCLSNQCIVLPHQPLSENFQFAGLWFREKCMTNTKEWNMVLELLSQQTFAVLGTSRQGHAYSSLVAFCANKSGDSLFFATTRATRKYHNLAEDDRVTLLIDNRAEQDSPLYEAVAVTAYGTAEEMHDAERLQALASYLAKHPQLKFFVSAPSTALFRIKVDEYHLVQRFQNVTEFRMSR
jgi:nitroimidazol reductase NimA-like FMN-containing flavoprotein (pyridoxamine 5'-phosphate oxidase superfamily)